jgi:hypothetical protein
MISLRFIPTLCASLLLIGCAQFTPYRTAIPDPKAVNSQVMKCRVDDSKPLLLDENQAPLELCEDLTLIGSSGRRCADAGGKGYAECQSIQHRFYQAWVDETRAPAGRWQTGDYYLSFVEFDDQGWFANCRQMEALFALLNKPAMEKKKVLIQVYAHGWKRNASACDNNVVCFSRLLERTDLVEKSNNVFSFMLKRMPKTPRQNNVPW